MGSIVNNYGDISQEGYTDLTRPGVVSMYTGGEHGASDLCRVAPTSAKILEFWNNPRNNDGFGNPRAIQIAPYSAWLPSTVYQTYVGNTGHPDFQMIKPTKANGCLYYIQASGMTGSIEPVWPTAQGSSVVSGTVNFVCFINFNMPGINTYGYGFDGSAGDLQRHAYSVGIKRSVSTGNSHGMSVPASVPSAGDLMSHNYDFVNYVGTLAGGDNPVAYAHMNCYSVIQSTIELYPIQKSLDCFCDCSRNDEVLNWAPSYAMPMGAAIMARFRAEHPSWNAWDARTAIRMSADNYSTGWEYGRKRGHDYLKTLSEDTLWLIKGIASPTEPTTTKAGVPLTGTAGLGTRWINTANASGYTMKVFQRDDNIFYQNKPIEFPLGYWLGWGTYFNRDKTGGYGTVYMDYLDQTFSNFTGKDLFALDPQPPILAITSYVNRLTFNLKPYNQSNLNRTIIVQLDSAPSSGLFGTWPSSGLSNPIPGSTIIYDSTRKDYNSFDIRNNSPSGMSNLYYIPFSQDIYGRWSRLEKNIIYGPYTINITPEKKTFFVDRDIPISGDGLTWETAFKVLNNFNVDTPNDSDVYVKYYKEKIDVGGQEAITNWLLPYTTNPGDYTTRIFFDAVGVGTKRHLNASKRTTFEPAPIEIGAFTQVGTSNVYSCVNPIRFSDYTLGMNKDRSDFFLMKQDGSKQPLKCFITSGLMDLPSLTAEEILSIPVNHYAIDYSGYDYILYLNVGSDPTSLQFLFYTVWYGFSFQEVYGISYNYVQDPMFYAPVYDGSFNNILLQYSEFGRASKAVRCSFGNIITDSKGLFTSTYNGLILGSKYEKCIVHDVYNYAGEPNTNALFTGVPVDIDSLIVLRAGPIAKVTNDYLGYIETQTKIRNLISLDEGVGELFSVSNYDNNIKIDQDNICLNSPSWVGCFSPDWIAITNKVSGLGVNNIYGNALNYKGIGWITTELYNELKRLIDQPSSFMSAPPFQTGILDFKLNNTSVIKKINGIDTSLITGVK
jgi:hypothetical protein